MLQGYTPPKESDLMFDTIGHSYGVALLSQSSHERARTLEYLNTLADDMIQENKSYGSVLYRNMTRLKKAFPDLANLEKKLAGFMDYYRKK